MKKIAVVYWSGTGNTKRMAEAVAEGAKGSGTEVRLWSVSDVSMEDVLMADAVALGCPSMGAEVLEEDEMEPFVTELEEQKERLNGKPLALFGSFDWGAGEWMVDWEARMKQAGCKLIAAGLRVQNTPDQNGLAACKKLGADLALH